MASDRMSASRSVNARQNPSTARTIAVGALERVVIAAVVWAFLAVDLAFHLALAAPAESFDPVPKPTRCTPIPWGRTITDERTIDNLCPLP